MRNDFGFGRHAGEKRPAAKKVVIRFPVTVTIEWPEDVPYSEEVAIERALGMIPQSDEVDVGPPGTIVLASRFAECTDTEAEIAETVEVRRKIDERYSSCFTWGGDGRLSGLETTSAGSCVNRLSVVSKAVATPETNRLNPF